MSYLYNIMLLFMIILSKGAFLSTYTNVGKSTLMNLLILYVMICITSMSDFIV